MTKVTQKKSFTVFPDFLPMNCGSFPNECVELWLSSVLPMQFEHILQKFFLHLDDIQLTTKLILLKFCHLQYKSQEIFLEIIDFSKISENFPLKIFTTVLYSCHTVDFMTAYIYTATYVPSRMCA